MISIIIPVYNAEKYLDRCFESIYNQTYKFYEVIIVDDGSTDGSSLICKKWAEIDHRFNYYYKKNGGSASARNYGLNLVKGDYISFIDADDYVDIDFLYNMFNSMQSSNADIVQCDFLETKNDTICYEMPQKKIKYLEYSNIEYLKCFCNKSTYLKVAVLWNKIYKKELFSGLQFPVGKGIDDEFLICEVIYRAKTIYVIEDVLYYYFMSPNSQMRSIPTLKSVDCVYAIENQLTFFINIRQPKLYNSLLYRYYSSVSSAYNFVKKSYPDEKKLIRELNDKLSTWKITLLKKEVPLSDKILLILRIKFPETFEKINKKRSI